VTFTLLIVAAGIVIYLIQWPAIAPAALIRASCTGKLPPTEALVRAIAGLTMAKPFRLYICSDIHASERAWRKLINATRANTYRPTRS